MAENGAGIAAKRRHGRLHARRGQRQAQRAGHERPDPALVIGCLKPEPAAKGLGAIDQLSDLSDLCGGNLLARKACDQRRTLKR